MKKQLLSLICVVLIWGMVSSAYAFHGMGDTSTYSETETSESKILNVNISPIPEEENADMIGIFFNGGWGTNGKKHTYLFTYRVTFTNLSDKCVLLNTQFRYTTPTGKAKYGVIDGGASSQSSVPGYLRPITIDAGQTLTFDYGWVDDRNEFPIGVYRIEILRNGTKIGESSVTIGD